MRRWSAVATVILLVGAGGCTRLSSGAPLPPPPEEVEVTMSDFRYDYETPVRGGRVVFRVHNAGAINHELQLIPLTEDIPPIEEQLRGTTRRSVGSVGGTPSRAPGASGVFAVDLEPGRRYAMVCFLRDPEGQVYALRGMNSEFRAFSPDGQSVPPPPDPAVEDTTTTTTQTP